MPKPVIRKTYVILGKQDEGQLERLSQTLSNLFSYMNLISDIYLVSENLSESISQVRRIQKDVSEFLRESLFARLYVHLVHPAPQSAMEEIDWCYQDLKRATREFDEEGYLHQEVPRLMLLPVIIPDTQVEPTSLIGLFDGLKSAFLLPCLYLDSGTFFLGEDEELLAKTEKIYYGRGSSRELADIVLNIYQQDILDESCATLESGALLMGDSCPASLIVSAQEGVIYTCMNALQKKESLTYTYGQIRVDTLINLYYERDKSKRNCLACRDRVVGSFSDLSLPVANMHQMGALLYHFGTLHHEREEYVEAMEDYEKSLKLSPPEEADSISFRLGITYTKVGRYDQALEAFSRAEHSYHDQYYFHFFTGLCSFEKDDYSAALKKFSRAVYLQPLQEDLVSILVYMGTCHNSLGEYEKALVHLEKAKEAAGHVKEIYSALGFCHFGLKDYDRAIDNLRRAVEIDPYSAIDYASLGANYREKGESNTAITMYEKALTLHPNMTSAKENLERLKSSP